MAEYTFKKLSDVEALAEVPEGANAFIEINGEIKKVPGEGLGGAGGIKTAIIKSSDYDDALSFFATSRAALPATYECINMTFEEAYGTMANGEPLNCVLMMPTMGCINEQCMCAFTGQSVFGVPCIVIGARYADMELFWTANGISLDQPGSSNPPV